MPAHTLAFGKQLPHAAGIAERQHLQQFLLQLRLLWREFPLELKFEFAVGKCIRAEQSIHILWHKFLKGFAGALECLKCWLILDMLSLSLTLSAPVCVCVHINGTYQFQIEIFALE